MSATSSDQTAAADVAVPAELVHAALRAAEALGRQVADVPVAAIAAEAGISRSTLLRRLGGTQAGPPDDETAARQRIERLAMEAVMAAERANGFDPVDVSAEKRGYDVESRVPGEGRLRFVE